ncbi:MAG: squalene synthase HpnC [Planctomycetota bacterium]|jgi:squalene synthase HpnC
MATAIIEQLDTYGPDRCDRLDTAAATRYAHELVRTQYENFSVVSWLLPKRYRDDFARIYSFCRWADDLADEAGDRDRALELLGWWRRELAACYAGEPRHPVFIALEPTIQKCDIPAKPFEDLIDAFEQDQRVIRYDTWDEAVDYCTRSADPVGRLVLYAAGYRDEERQRLSDRTCTALQLINFWRDVRRDILERDRVYVPSGDLARHGLTHDRLIEHVVGETPFTHKEYAAYATTIHDLTDRTWELFSEGRALLPALKKDVRLSIELFTLGGEAVARRVEAIGYRTCDYRPSLSKTQKLTLMARALWGTLLGGGA